MTDTLTINAVGTPAPQGSKRAFVVNGKPVMAESSTKVKPWRQDVAAAAETAARNHWRAGNQRGWETPAGPLQIRIVFHLARPRYHFRTGKNAHMLRANAPSHVDKKPDLDKLVRATLDALTTSGVIHDDAQIADLHATKVYAHGATGARISITPLTAAPAENPSSAGAATTQEAAS